MIQHMKERVSEMSIPENIIECMSRAENQQHEGLRTSVEIVNQLKSVEGIRGAHIMPVAWETILPDIINLLRLFPQPRLTVGP
jgi:methylenetetrahydrofolate reductase (NADPH)